MENNELMLELLQQIERTGKKQLRAQRLRCLFSLVGALACVAAVVMLLGVLPQVEAMIAHMQTTLNNLESVTAQLTSMDLEGMIVNVDELVSVGRETLTETAGMLESLDMETLNRAIRDLAAVVEPLARFFR
jgi:hypothetical protein